MVYKVNSVMKVLHCKAEYAINLKPYCTFLDTENVILLSNLPGLWTLVVH